MAQFIPTNASAPEGPDQPPLQQEQSFSTPNLPDHAKLLHLLKAARSFRFTPYIKATCRHLAQSSIFWQTAAALTDAALHQYSAWLCAQTAGEESVSLNFSGRMITFGPAPDAAMFAVEQDRDEMIQLVQTQISPAIVRGRLWEALGAEVWISVLVWTVQDLDLSTGISVFESLEREPFKHSLWLECFSPDASGQHQAFDATISYWAKRISNQLAHAVGLEDLSAMALEQFLGLTAHSEAIDLKISITLPPVMAELPWAVLAHREPAQKEQPQTVNSGDSGDVLSNVLDLDSNSDPPLELEHYLNRTQDLAVLPWELLTQLKQSYGLAAVQLQFLWAAHAMIQRRPVSNSFTLKVSDIREQLDWPLDSEIPSPNPLKLVSQLGEMKISTVWMTDPRSAQVEAFRIKGAPWDILSDVQGNLDWTTGLLSNPQQVYITLRPGLWTTHLLELGGAPVEQAFQDFGALALSLLRLNYCKEPLLLSLLIYLMFREALLTSTEQRPTDTVQELLSTVLPYAADLSGTVQPEHALILIQTWHQALEALIVLGWRPWSQAKLPHYKDFYQCCPPWLLQSDQKPKDWVEQWLALPVQIAPPAQPIASSGKMTESALLATDIQRPTARLRFERLTGSEVRSARKALQLTQSQLAEALHVHQSLIAKIEAGRRAISDDLEQPLRQFLAL